jgi:uridine kinase
MVLEDKQEMETVVKHYMDYIKPMYEKYVEPVSYTSCSLFKLIDKEICGYIDSKLLIRRYSLSTG